MPAYLAALALAWVIIKGRHPEDHSVTREIEASRFKMVRAAVEGKGLKSRAVGALFRWRLREPGERPAVQGATGRMGRCFGSVNFAGAG
jgi:hypothetical protein